jgi:hypothetical protein
MNSAIAKLDDRAAISVLDTLTRNALEPATSSLKLDVSLRQALQGEFALAPESESVSRGDLARTALQLLATDSVLEARIITLAQHVPAQQFDFGLLGGAAVLTLALSVLQTEMDISWDKKKGLHVALKKHAASDSLLREFLSKIVNFKS